MRKVIGIKDAETLLSSNRGLNLNSNSQTIISDSKRIFGKPLDTENYVREIIHYVIKHGDEAIKDLTLKIEGITLDRLNVNEEEIHQAYKNISRTLKYALEKAAERIETFHSQCIKTQWMNKDKGYGQKYAAVESTGAYIPGGTAKYPSTVLMTTIPAKIAGVKDISITCPVSQNGLPPESVLAAAHIAGVRNVYCVGGAQSIAAFAYGTESISKVDIICGPGNIFVTLAKKIVYGDVGIDGLYGPTETLIIADDSANPSFIASDLLAQAEHDKQAKPILITTSMRIATEVEHELALKLERLSRKDIAQISTQNEGIIAIVETIQDAIKLSNTFGPEHLCLATSYPEEHLSNVTNAGMIFLGDFSHEVLGDYGAGPSHVMPTAGTARFNSGLGIHTFQKIIPIVGINKPDSLEIGQIAAIIAKEEGLTAHAEAAEIRQEFI